MKSLWEMSVNDMFPDTFEFIDLPIIDCTWALKAVNVYKCIMNGKFCQEFEYHISNSVAHSTRWIKDQKNIQHWLSGCTWHMAFSYIGDTCRIIEGNIWTQTLRIFGTTYYLLTTKQKLGKLGWISNMSIHYLHEYSLTLPYTLEN